MTTESNANNFTSNISKTNLDLMTENGTKEIKSDKKFHIDDLTQPKKVYYLASCDENIEILKKGQEKGLTDILLALKKDHDNIKMESKKIIDETEQLEKKIMMIRQMDARTNKKNIDSKVENENIKKAIEATKVRLKEEEYKKKTLTALLEKIKKDININEKSLLKSYDKQNELNQKLQKEKLLQNEIKAKGNQINSQISQQKDKNIHDSGEYKLQVQYYNTIIDQKMDFIRAAEERKERQIKIAQDAKKSSGDKDENEKREKLEMLYLINNYLQKKMEKELEKNKDIEDAFSKIRLICGTEIEELNKKFMDLRNEIVVDVDSVSKKNIQIIKSKDVEMTINNDNLINEESQLNEQYQLNKELNNLVNLRYDQVVNSLRKLCTEESKNYMRDISLNASRMYNANQSSNNANTQNNNELTTEKEIKEIKEEGEEKEIKETKGEGEVEEIKETKGEREVEEKGNEEQQEQKEEKGENEDIEETPSGKPSSKKKLTYEEGEEEKLENNNEINSKNKTIEKNNQEMEIVDNTENNTNEKNINENEENNMNNNAGNINNSSTVNINMSGIGSMSVLEQDEEAKLIKSYKEYLAQAEKTIDALFLMKTKNDFLQMVRDKASEFDEANKTLKIIRKVQDINKKGRSSISKSFGVKDELNSELEYCTDDNESTKEKELQEKIFRTYMNAEKKKMDRFINNEKEGKLNKKSN